MSIGIGSADVPQVFNVEAEIWRAQMVGSHILDHYSKLDDNKNIPVNREFEKGVVAAVDNSITNTIKQLPSGPWVDFCSGSGRVTGALWLAHGDNRHPPILVDSQKDITGTGVKKVVKPTVLTADILQLNEKELVDFGPFGVATIIQPPSYEILKTSMDLVKDTISPGGTMIVYSSHDMKGIMGKLQDPAGYTSWPLSNPACRIFQKK